MQYLKITAVEKFGGVTAAFTTRHGGVSEGHLSSMNLGLSRGDKKENVQKNYRIIADTLGLALDSFVLTAQTHTNNIKIVTKEDCTKGLEKIGFNDTDGLVTNQPGIALVAFFADCVPVFLYDPFKKIIALLHAGWRGSVSGIAKNGVKIMTETFGADPKDIIAFIGPSICKNCFEIGEEVADEIAKINAGVLTQKQNGKYTADLWQLNKSILLGAGLLGENISISGICTFENDKDFFSHRKTGGKRGNLAAVISLKNQTVAV